MRVLYDAKAYKVTYTIGCGFFPYSITLQKIVYADSKSGAEKYMREKYSNFTINSITEGSF